MQSERYDNYMESIDFSNCQIKMLDCARFLQVITTINLKKYIHSKLKLKAIRYLNLRGIIYLYSN